MNGNFFENEPIEPIEPPSLWKQNHGNLLLAFLGLILLVGAGILTYRQTRFVPPSFPGGESIETPKDVAEADQPLADDSIVIQITGAANDAGSMMVAIYGAAENFNVPQNAEMLEAVDVRNGEATLAMAPSRLPPRFAVAAYHDENGDRELNRNRFGIPTERYGFTRAARGLTGPPSFDQAVVERPPPGMSLQILVR